MGMNDQGRHHLRSSPDPGSAPLVLNLLGTPNISHCGKLIHPARSQARALLFRLGARLQPVSRDELAALFWPEIANSTARHNLRRLLNCVKEELHAQDALIATSDYVALNKEQVWSDVDSLLHFAAGDCPEGWQAVAQLYTGAFLAGFSLRTNAEFEIWQAALDDQLRSRTLHALDRLIESSTQSGNYDAAIKHARRYLEIDAVAESVHRRLITLYARTGERELALHQFETCVLILERELGVGPLPETRAALDEALYNPLPPVDSPCANGLPTPLNSDPSNLLPDFGVLLAHSGRVAEVELEESDLQTAIASRIEALSALARQVVEAAAVLDPQLDFELICATTARTPSEVSDALDELVERQLMQNAHDGPQFSHDFVQHVILLSLSVSRRRQLHRRAAESILRSSTYPVEYRNVAAAVHCAVAGSGESAERHFLNVSATVEALSSAHSSQGHADAQRNAALMCKLACVLVLDAHFSEAAELLNAALSHLGTIL
jgi:DNA-binding SARP family transcriptional activator